MLQAMFIGLGLFYALPIVIGGTFSGISWLYKDTIIATKEFWKILKTFPGTAKN